MAPSSSACPLWRCRMAQVEVKQHYTRLGHRPRLSGSDLKTMKEKQKYKSEVMRDSGLSARHGCTGCRNSQAFHPRVCRCRCCCPVFLLASLVLHCLGCPVSTAYSRGSPKSYDVRIFTLTTTAVPCAEKLNSSDVCVLC